MSSSNIIPTNLEYESKTGKIFLLDFEIISTKSPKVLSIDTVLKSLSIKSDVFSKVKTASRYLKVGYSPYFFMYEYDKELWNYKEEDGYIVEPEFMLPIVPMQLLQRTSSPGFGFSFSTFSYKLEENLSTTDFEIIDFDEDDKF